MKKLKRRATTVVIVFLILTIISSAIAITVRLNAMDKEETVTVNDFGNIKGNVPLGGIYKDRAFDFKKGYVGNLDFNFNTIGGPVLNIASEYDNDYLRIVVDPDDSSGPRVGSSFGENCELDAIPDDDIRTLVPSVVAYYDRMVLEFDIKIDSVGDINGSGSNFLRIDFGDGYGSKNVKGEINLMKTKYENYYCFQGFQPLEGVKSPLFKYGSWYNLRFEYLQWASVQGEGFSECLVYVNGVLMGTATGMGYDGLRYQVSTASIVPRNLCTNLVVGIDNFFVGRNFESINIESE